MARELQSIWFMKKVNNKNTKAITARNATTPKVTKILTLEDLARVTGGCTFGNKTNCDT